MTTDTSTVILSSSYFAPISWYAMLARKGNAVIDIHENYLRQTWRNRCRIAGANRILDLTIPVTTSGNHTPVKDVQIDYSTNWQRIHWHAIRSAYGKSAFFEYYADKIEALYNTQPDALAGWNEACFELMQKAIKLNVSVTKSSEYIEIVADAPDYRLILSPKYRGSKEFVPQTSSYIQVFQERFGFIPDLSILDLLFCCGPDSLDILQGK